MAIFSTNLDTLSEDIWFSEDFHLRLFLFLSLSLSSGEAFLWESDDRVRLRGERTTFNSVTADTVRENFRFKRLKTGDLTI